jgi:hypothetical protein
MDTDPVEHKGQGSKRKYHQKKPQPAISAPLKRTRRSSPSSILKVPRNFQKPFATAKLFYLSMVQRQFDDEFHDAVSVSEQELSAYRSDLSDHGIRPWLALCAIDDLVGKGVFLRPDANGLDPGTFIGIYAGDYRFVHANDPQRSDYGFTVLSDLELSWNDLDLIEGARLFETNQFCLEVDGAQSGNFTRFINHADKENANVEHRYILMDDGTIQIGYWTKTRIRPGEQLLLNYGSGFWLNKGIQPLPSNPRKHMLYPDGEVI